jgi:hypothetical protein
MSSLCATGEKHGQAINALFPVDVVNYYKQGLKP